MSRLFTSFGFRVSSLPGQQLVTGNRRKEGDRRWRGPLGGAEALDGLGADASGPFQRLFGLAQYHHRGAAVAGGKPKAGGEPDRFSPHAKRCAEDIHAQPLGQHHGIGRGATGQHDQELVHAGAAQQIVAAQQARGAAPPPGTAARRRHRRRAASSSAQSRRCRTAPGTASCSSAARGRSRETAWPAASRGYRRRSAGPVARSARRPREANPVRAPVVIAQHQVEPKLPVGRSRRRAESGRRSRPQQAVDPFLGHSVRNQDNREPPAAGFGAHGRQQLPHRHARQVGVQQRQTGRIGRGHRGQRGLGGENDLDARPRCQQNRFNGGQQSGIGRGEQKCGRAVGEHPRMPP